MKYTDTLFSKFKRLLKITLIESLWLIPLLFAGWYVKNHLSAWCDSYFGIAEAQNRINFLTERLNRAGEPVLWNPATIATYIKIGFLSLTAATKLNSLLLISGMSAKIGSLLTTILQFLAIVYAVIRLKRAYRAETQTQSVANTVCRALIPEIESLHKEITELRTLMEQKKIT